MYLPGKRLLGSAEKFFSRREKAQALASLQKCIASIFFFYIKTSHENAKTKICHMRDKKFLCWKEVLLSRNGE